MTNVFYSLPIGAFQRKPAANTEINIASANGKSTYFFPKTKSESTLKHIANYIAKNFKFDFELSDKDLSRVAKFLGKHTHAWQTLLTRYDHSQANDLFLKLFQHDVSRPLPNLASDKTDKKKLAEIFALQYSPTGILDSQKKVFKRLGFDDDQTTSLLAHAYLYSWINRNRDINVPESLSSAETSIRILLDNFDSFDIDDKLLFIKTAGLTLIDKTSIATISHIRLHSTYQLFRDLCEKLQEVSKELDTRETLELMESFNEELSKIVQNFGRDHKRTEFVDQFRGILEL